MNIPSERYFINAPTKNKHVVVDVQIEQTLNDFQDIVI